VRSAFSHEKKDTPEMRRILTRAGAAAGKAFGTLAGSLFPDRCPVCGEIPDGEGAMLCRACFEMLSFVEEPVCLTCGRTVADGAEEFCAECAAKPKSFERGYPLLWYDDTMRRIVSDIKYRNRRRYAIPFGRLMAARFFEAVRRSDCLVPVPVHRSRLKKRGFNQAELLARIIQERTGVPVRTDLLFRVRKTEAQKALSPDERIRNLETAFSASRAAASAGRILLIDDIYTTGSTAEACTRVLKAAGAEHVSVMTLCAVPEY